MVWKSKGDGEIRKYDFSYDAANRLMKADFNQYTSGSFNKTANVDFSVKMGDGADPLSAYDANGNIKQMQPDWREVTNCSLAQASACAVRENRLFLRYESEV